MSLVKKAESQFVKMVVCLKRVFLVEESEASLINKSSCLAQTLGVTKFIMVIAMDSFKLCCVTYVRLGCSTNPLQRLVH
jgi:hypothetical protein